MNRRKLGWLALALVLACDRRAASGHIEHDERTSMSPGVSPSERAPALDEVDPCTELGVIVPRSSVELHAPRAGILRASSDAPVEIGELVYAIEAADDLPALEVQQAELAEASATRERYAAERNASTRVVRNAEQLGEYLAADERDKARDAHAIAIRELDRADAVHRAASARLAAARARIETGQLVAPFTGRVVRELAIGGAWVDAGELLAVFASTDDLILRVGLPAEHAPPGSIEVRWRWPNRPDQDPNSRFVATLLPATAQVDELSGLRLYEASIDPQQLANHALGDSVRVELPTCPRRPQP